MSSSRFARTAGLSMFLVMGTVSAQEEPPAKDAEEDVTELSNIQVEESALGALGKEVGATAFGFDKPLLETPRSVSFITTEQIDMFGVNSVNDLARLVPGVFTNQRRGYEGAINVRGVPAETLYNGMRRLNSRGCSASLWSGPGAGSRRRRCPSPYRTGCAASGERGMACLHPQGTSTSDPCDG